VLTNACAGPICAAQSPQSKGFIKEPATKPEAKMQMIEQTGATPATETRSGSAPVQSSTAAPAQQAAAPAPRFRDWAAI
jgi:hypothetical protein